MKENTQMKKENQIDGTIVKGIAGFYYVDTGNAVYECKARGVFKNKSMKPYVGDDVVLDLTDGDTPVISGIRERRNVFDRPPVANVEQFIVVNAFESPAPNFVVIDKFLTMAELKDVDVVMCFNKADLSSEKEAISLKRIYGDIYPVIFADARTEEGIWELIPYLKGKKSALAGPSGVGKSTIMNSLIHDLNAETSTVSEKTKRGRHTTRHVELFHLDFGGMIFDTPGFTSFDAPLADEAELAYLFREFSEYTDRCRFNGCRHQNEPGCAVKDAVLDGSISESRYKSYLGQLEEIRQREKKKYT